VLEARIKEIGGQLAKAKEQIISLAKDLVQNNKIGMALDENNGYAKSGRSEI
jgi:hypothetical protein